MSAVFNALTSSSRRSLTFDNFNIYKFEKELFCLHSLHYLTVPHSGSEFQHNVKNIALPPHLEAS
jgi:hypothetical protein